jgi:GTPase SAR1 family protein
MESSNKSYDYLFKLIIVGDSCVGKTSILQRFHGENFTQVAVPTIGKLLVNNFNLFSYHICYLCVKRQKFQTISFKTIFFDRNRLSYSNNNSGKQSD